MRRCFWITGKVQQVGFRQFARESAQKHGIIGWVKNLSDGRVAAEGQASDEALKAWENDLRQGPQHAAVESIEIRNLYDVPDEEGFHIL